MTSDGRRGEGRVVHGKPNRWVMEWAKGARGKRASVMNVCSCCRRRRKSPHLKITAAHAGSPRWPGCGAPCAPVRYLGNARDDIGVFAGVVFLVAAEYSHLATLQNVNLQRQKSNNKDAVWGLQTHFKLRQTGFKICIHKPFLQLLSQSDTN